MKNHCFGKWELNCSRSIQAAAEWRDPSVLKETNMQFPRPSANEFFCRLCVKLTQKR